jgi:Protein of unknown function (DUF1761)
MSSMPDVNLLTVLAATVAAFILSSTYYSVFAAELAQVSDAAAAGEQPPPWKLGVELLRSFTLAAIVAGLASQGDIDTWTGGLSLGLALWIGFPLVLWTGAMIWENTPGKLAVLHGGDWLAKLLLVALIVSVWQ